MLATLRGRVLRAPQHFPQQERLAVFRFYTMRNRLGQRIGNLVPWSPETYPAFRIVGPNNKSRATLVLDRRTKALWRIRSAGQANQGRLRRVRVTAGEYDWFDRDGNAIAALVPIAGTHNYELRGGEEIVTLFNEQYKVPLVGVEPSETVSRGAAAAQSGPGKAPHPMLLESTLEAIRRVGFRQLYQHSP